MSLPENDYGHQHAKQTRSSGRIVAKYFYDGPTKYFGEPSLMVHLDMKDQTPNVAPVRNAKSKTVPRATKSGTRSHQSSNKVLSVASTPTTTASTTRKRKPTNQATNAQPVRSSKRAKTLPPPVQPPESRTSDEAHTKDGPASMESGGSSENTLNSRASSLLSSAPASPELSPILPPSTQPTGHEDIPPLSALPTEGATSEVAVPNLDSVVASIHEHPAEMAPTAAHSSSEQASVLGTNQDSRNVSLDGIGESKKTDGAPQLLTPPPSASSSPTQSAESPSLERPKRTRKQAGISAGMVPTVSNVDALPDTPSSMTASFQEGADIEFLDRNDKEPSLSVRRTGRSQSSKNTRVSSTKKTLTAKSRGSEQKTSSTVTKNKALQKPRTTSTILKGARHASHKPSTTSRKTTKMIFGHIWNSPNGIISTKIRVGKGSLKGSASLMVSLHLPQPDPEKLELSRRLTKRAPLESKPGTLGKPEVWADTRQALCETLPYFKSPQSGCYSNDNHVYGFLFDSVGHCREYMDENLIICRAGGSMGQSPTGEMVQKKDHSMKEAQVQAVLNDIAHCNPVVVICGDGNATAPCRMPHKYCVLGWFKPILVWSEKTAGKGSKVFTTIKYRLERLNRHIPAWHAPQLSLISGEDRAIAGVLVSKKCETCDTAYPQVYLRGWMCLNASCNNFWQVNGVDAPYGVDGLEYNPAFLLLESEAWKGENEQDEPEPAPLRPQLLDVGNAIGQNLTYIYTRGICCPHCGRGNARRFFKGWFCESPDCNFSLFPEHRLVVPAMLHKPWDVAPTLVRNKHLLGVHLQIFYKHGYKLSIYRFDGIEGYFIHAAATKAVLQEANGPNDMFAEMQMKDMGLERRTFAVKKILGDKSESVSATSGEANTSQDAPIEDTIAVNQSQEGMEEKDEEVGKAPEFAPGDLMTAFSMNYGMPYKFVASGASQSFDKAPWPITETRRRLNWAVQAFLDESQDHKDFNEELVFAYLEGQKIEYHDDGEEGLGPRIAALSLGGRAKMHLRMKTKHYTGCSKSGILIEEQPILGSIQYEERVKMWNELQQVRFDLATYNRRRKEIPKEIGIFEKRTKKAEDLVTVTLNHGDIAIMAGYDIQKYLEHKVVPEGQLRFALTCREVLEHHLKPEERPQYEVERDVQTYDGPKV